MRSTRARTVDARAIASCWNAFLAKRVLGKPNPRGTHEPFLLTGTPHEGKANKGYLTAEGQSVRTPVVLAG